MPTEMTASFLPADNDEIIEARAVLAARQRVRDSFHCRSASGKCRCVYCTRDVEGLVEHAADYELRHFSEQKKREEVESKLSALESECEHLRAENARLRKLLEPPYADSAMPRSRKAREWRARALKAEAAHAEAERRETRTEKDQG